MAINLKHLFQSAKGDGSDATIVRPSNWNANHKLTLAGGNLIGRLTAGDGDAEEIAISALMAAALSSADGAAFLAAIGAGGFTTGDGKPTLKSTPDTGWLLMDDGTFGDAVSGSSNRNNADCAALFALLYNNIADADCPLLTSTGAATTRAAQGSAATAFSSHCRMSLPKQLGRAIVGAGAGSGLTSRALGSKFGEESHTLTPGEIPNHKHKAPIDDLGHLHGNDALKNNSSSTTSGGGFPTPQAGISFNATVQPALTGVKVWDGVTHDQTGNQIDSQAGGGAHNITQASTAWNIMVKL